MGTAIGYDIKHLMKKPLSITLPLLLGCVLQSSAAQTQPNIVLFVADDMGFQDCGVYGGKDIPTPNIDSLAKNGVRFTHAYTSGCVCSPTRAGLMTGRYQQRFGMEQNLGSEPNAGLPTTEKTIANTLKALGYRTYALGKWHLGEDRPEHHPNQRGFDEYFGHLSGARTYFQFTGTSSANKLQRNSSPAQR